eukprot:CAMPEP_0203756986 /NCGR_PEP_ID=MMETSP0098-20131031/10152_1 /ASSEMBLY_ACC=CAM_ASM_000208 /TAXON_ID=96639 /ORGANISM=" , Strain NY0313808BC1" /LENGTH=274 /DNA_ID=CAMNT_0050649065 /DNA_START=688 /DNA_END=1513 /DNA_ORIENTATION=-
MFDMYFATSMRVHFPYIGEVITPIGEESIELSQEGDDLKEASTGVEAIIEDQESQQSGDESDQLQKLLNTDVDQEKLRYLEIVAAPYEAAMRFCYVVKDRRQIGFVTLVTRDDYKVPKSFGIARSKVKRLYGQIYRERPLNTTSRGSSRRSTAAKLRTPSQLATPGTPGTIGTVPPSGTGNRVLTAYTLSDALLMDSNAYSILAPEDPIYQPVTPGYTSLEEPSGRETADSSFAPFRGSSRCSLLTRGSLASRPSFALPAGERAASGSSKKSNT